MIILLAGYKKTKAEDEAVKAQYENQGHTVKTYNEKSTLAEYNDIYVAAVGVDLVVNMAKPDPDNMKFYELCQRVAALNNAKVSLRPEVSSLQMGIQKFKGEHDPSKTILIMMKFSGGEPSGDRKLEDLFNTIKLELDRYGLTVARADEKYYSSYLWENVQIYMSGCDYGIAVLENLYSDEMNPNVALEYGYMLAKGKRVLLLKEKSFKNIRGDLIGTLWQEFEFGDSESMKKAIHDWMVDLDIKPIKHIL